MIRKAIWTSGFIALLLALGWQTARTQDTVGVITGTVKDEDGKPLVGASISIEREDAKGHYDVKTDKNGKFIHIGLPLGKFTVSVIRDGKKSITVPNVHNRLRGPTNVDIDLSK